MNRGLAQINVHCVYCGQTAPHLYYYVEFWMHNERTYYKWACNRCGYTIQDKSAVERVEKRNAELLGYLSYR